MLLEGCQGTKQALSGASKISTSARLLEQCLSEFVLIFEQHYKEECTLIVEFTLCALCFLVQYNPFDSAIVRLALFTSAFD